MKKTLKTPCPLVIEPLEHRLQLSGGYVMHDLGTFGRNAEVVALNNAGQAVIVNGAFSYLWSQKGGLQQIAPDRDFVTATSINASGQITGSFEIGDQTHVFLYDKNGFVDLGTYAGGHYAVGMDINNSGQISCAAIDNSGTRHAVVYSHGSFVDLGTGEHAIAQQITDEGVVLASVDHPNTGTGFSINPIANVFDPTAMTAAGMVVTAQHVTPPARYNSELIVKQGQNTRHMVGVFGLISSVAINSAGIVIGTEDPRGPVSAGFVSQKGRLVYLDKLISKNSGLEIEDAGAINDKGQIGAIATDADGKYHAVLLTPTKARARKTHVNTTHSANQSRRVTDLSTAAISRLYWPKSERDIRTYRSCEN